MRTIHSTSTGNAIPVTTNLNVKPLMRAGKPVTNGKGQHIMNDQWIYVNDGRQNYSINVNRAKFCEKIYLSNVTIQESIGKKKLMDAELKTFVDQVSDKLVFEKYGRWYRIYLRKATNRTFTIAKVVPYIAVYNPNARILGMYAYEICVDWRKKFSVQ